jgi:hypothetical protein
MESFALRSKSPHVYQICNAMLFASRMLGHYVVSIAFLLLMAYCTNVASAQSLIGGAVLESTSAQAPPTVWNVLVSPPSKSGARLSGVRMVQPINFEQNCDNPISKSGTLNIQNAMTNQLMSGRIVGISISGTNASDFTITQPTSIPANVPLTGTQIEIRFDSPVLGTRTAQLRIATVDSTGAPVLDTLLINLNGTRRKRSFELIQQRFNFGTLPPNTSDTRTFWWLRNTGTIPITWQISPDFDPFFSIVNTVPSPVKNAAAQRWFTTVNPGDSVQLTVRFNGDIAGQYRNADFQPTDFECGTSIFFKLEANTTPNPPNITVRNVVQGVEKPLLSEIYLGEFACPNTDAAFKDTTLKIYTSGQVPLIVTGVTFSNPDFQLVSPQSLVSQRPDTITFNTSRDITIRYTPRTPSVQDILATMTLFSNSTTGTPAGSTTVNLRVRKDSINLTVSSQLVNFGSVVRGAMPPAQTITIRNTGTLPQAIPPFSSTNFLATFPTGTLQPGDSVVVTLRAINTSAAGVFRETWIIQDNCFRQTPIALQITVNRPAPTIGLAVPVSFGRLACAIDTVITLPISNTGNDANDLVISNISIIGQNSPFSFVQQPIPPISIPSGQSRSIQIRFRPNRTGAISDVLRIVSNAEGTPTFDAPLNGSKDSVSFRLSRTTVNFVNIVPGEQPSDTLTVINTGTVPLTWGASSYTIENPFSIQIIPPITPVGGSSRVQVNFLGSVNDASATGRLADTCGRAQTINVSATILRPYISATPIISFGTLTCETSSQGQISITNTGGQDLVVVNTIQSSSPLFPLQLPTTQIRLPRGASTTIPVEFRPLPNTRDMVEAIVTIGSNAANGTTTTTLRAIKNTLDFEFNKRDSSDLPNRVSLFLGNLPPNTPSVGTITLRNTGTLPLTWQTPAYSQDSLFLVESVSPNPTPRDASATMTVRYVGSACPGSKITATGIEVFRNYGSDCLKPPARVTLSAQTLPATARLWTDSIAANISDTVALPIRLRNPQYLREAGVTGFSFVLRYDFSTLVPLDNPRGTIVGKSRLQPVTLMLPTTIPADSVLGRVRFQATLGSTSGTLISIDSLRAIGTSGASCIIFDNTALQGKFTLGGICLEGGMRLVTKSTSATVLAQSKPNPASDVATIDFSLLERGLTTITVYSVMGEAVLQAMAERLEPGAYSFDMDVSRLPSGVYFYVLQTPTDRKTRRMEVIR